MTRFDPLCDSKLTVPREEVIKNVNLSLRGWVNYFHCGNSSQAFGKEPHIIMKTDIKYLEFNTGNVSNCGEPLEIEISSRDLNWEGVLLEKGWSPHFFPNNIITTSFYFALAIDSKFHWLAEDNGKIIDLKTNPGEIWMNPPNAPFTHVINDPCYFIILTIEKQTMFKYFYRELSEEKIRFLKNYNVVDESLEYFIRLFYNEVCLKGKNGILYFQNLLKLFSIYYIKNYSNYSDLMSDKQSLSKINQEDLENITKYINNNIERSITIEELAENFNYKKYHFLREFKKSTGITPYQYILKIKLEKAKELLKNNDIQISDIAYRLGFSDQSHLTNLFKRHFGSPPGVYKSS